MFTRDAICEYTLALCTQCTQPLLKSSTKPYFTWVAGVYISGLSDVHRMYTHVHTLMYFGHKTARKSGNLRVYMLWNGFGFLKGHLPMLPAPAYWSTERAPCLPSAMRRDRMEPAPGWSCPYRFRRMWQRE